MNRLLVFALPLLLGSCTLMTAGSPYTLGKQPAAGELTPSGTVAVQRSAYMVMTEARVSGLRPNQAYVAHYHLQGTAGAPPCESGGPPIMSSKIVGTTDASGALTLSGRVPSGDVLAATYFNIHTAADAEGTPADPGVACTAVRLQ